MLLILAAAANAHAADAAIWSPESAPDLMPVEHLETPSHESVALVVAGEPRAHIVFQVDGASAALQAALDDLQRLIERTTGATLPIVPAAPVHGNAIVVSDAARLRSADAVGDLPPEGFAILTRAGRVSIVGRGEGTTHGVYEFLERFVGVRFYWPDYDDGDVADAGTSWRTAATLR